MLEGLTKLHDEWVPDLVYEQCEQLRDGLDSIWSMIEVSRFGRN